MKELPLSNNEDVFIQSAIKEGFRTDNRELSEFRDLNVLFGRNYGTVLCSLGKTRVFASVSCEISTPKTSRPNEGTIFINVEMPTSQFDNNALSEYCILVNRILEKTIRDSNCLDLESLCIIAEEKVWNLRVDVVIVNHEGNLTDCACLAALVALAHFKRPDVTTCGDGEFIIHKPEEKDLIPIVLHHYPVCVTYALFDDGKIHVSDPTVIEERVSKVSLVIAVNAYNEICSLHLTGVALTSPFLIQQCAELAAERSKIVIKYVKESLEKDKAQREDPNFKAFTHLIELSKESVLNSSEFQKLDVEMSEDNASETSDNNESAAIYKLNQNTVSTVDKISSSSSSDSD